MWPRGERLADLIRLVPQWPPSRITDNQCICWDFYFSEWQQLCKERGASGSGVLPATVAPVTVAWEPVAVAWAPVAQSTPGHPAPPLNKHKTQVSTTTRVWFCFVWKCVAISWLVCVRSICVCRVLCA